MFSDLIKSYREGGERGTNITWNGRAMLQLQMVEDLIRIYRFLQK